METENLNNDAMDEIFDAEIDLEFFEDIGVDESPSNENKENYARKTPAKESKGHWKKAADDWKENVVAPFER